MKFRNILVPTDFSADAGRALDVAIELAQSSGACLHLLHSYQLVIDTTLPLDTPSVRLLWDQVRDAAERELQNLQQRAVEAGVKCETHLLAQAPSLAVVDTARRIPADLIVMGTRGLTGLKHVLLGSVAERTVRLAPCPVLTVKAEA